jgi:hypothetical protein
MKKILAPLVALLSLGACIHTRPATEVEAEESSRCDLVRAVLREPLPAQQLEQLSAEDGGGPTSVLAFVRQEQGVLERLFAGEPECRGERFRVVQEPSRKALVLLLAPEGLGYSYATQLAGPEGLPVQGTPQGWVGRGGGSRLTARR